MHRYIHSKIIHNSQDMQQPKYPWTDEWVKKMWYEKKKKEREKGWYVHRMEYYSAIKNNRIKPFAAMWEELEIIILSEVSQKERAKYQMISLICGI